MPLSSTTLIAQNRFETIFIFTYLLCGRGWVEGAYFAVSSRSPCERVIAAFLQQNERKPTEPQK